MESPCFQKGQSGAGDEIRTRDLQLGRLELYQLSYSRSHRFTFTPEDRGPSAQELDKETDNHYLKECNTFTGGIHVVITDLDMPNEISYM